MSQAHWRVHASRWRSSWARVRRCPTPSGFGHRRVAGELQCYFDPGRGLGRRVGWGWGGVAVAADSGQRKPKLRSRHRRHPTHHGDTKESSCSHRSSTAGTATLPTGSGTRGSCLLDGPSPPTSRSRSPPRTRGDYPPLTTTSPPSDGAHGLSTMTRACPARRARADAHGSSVSGHLFASLPPCKTAGSYTQT